MRGTRALTVAVAIALVAGAVLAGLVVRGGSGSDRRAAAAGGPSELVLLAVMAEPDPFVAVVGAAGPSGPAAMAIPPPVVLPLPGHGTGTVAQAAGISGPLLALSVSNLLGTWVDHRAVAEPEGLARAVDRSGGLTVDLPAPWRLGERDVGPGPVLLSGREVVAYLDGAPVRERSSRWGAVLVALLAGPPALRASDLLDVDDLPGVLEVLGAAAGARVVELPSTESAGGLRRADQEAARALLADAFGLHVEAPVRVAVLNANGVPGVGESVAELLVPGGFQVVSSTNARRFDENETRIYTPDSARVPEAERARALLGVGAVVLGGGPSGLADITIVVGKDFPSR